MRIRHRVVVAIVLACVVAASADAKPIHIPRQPDVHAGKIAFSYLGDVWIVDEDGSNPKRLTVHTAHESFPRFSPDGKWIAFSSDRHGNNDVFVMPATGGDAKPLTFHSAGDTVVGWSRDSKRVLFSSARGTPFPGISNLYEVSIEGGLEQAMPTDWGAYGTWSPDGKQLAFNRHPMVWWRKHYRGSYAADLWLFDVEKKSFKRLLDDDVPERERSNAFWPLFGNGEIFFVSDRETTAKPGTREALASANNLWKIPASGGAPAQVTHHTDGSLFFPSISSDGKTIVYEEGFGLWKLDTASGRASEVKIDLASDSKENESEPVVFRDEADDFDLSPSTKRAVASVHGELFTIATDKGTATRVTNSPSRESRPTWSPDGKRVAYVSDQSGRDEVWVSDVDGKNAKKLSDADSEKGSLAWSPDSKALAFTASDHKLYRAMVDTGELRTLAMSESSAIQGPEFSPDGKWIVYTKSDRDLRPHVHVVSTDGGDEHRVTSDLLSTTFGARWTPDGKKLVFIAGLLTGRENVPALYSVSLTKEEKDPMSRDVDEEPAADASDKDKDGEKEKKGPVDVKIDWDGLDRRIHQVTHLSDRVASVVPAPDSKSVAFVAEGDVDDRPTSTLYVVQADGDEQRRLTQSTPPDPDTDAGGGGGEGGIRSVQFSKDGKTLYFMEGSGVWSIGVGGSGGSDSKPSAASTGRAASASDGARKRVSFTVRVEVDRAAERRQVFGEAWRVMKNRFYDPAMHGVDWARMRSVYEPLVDDTGDVQDLQAVVSQMIGELNASHTGISGGGTPDPDAIRTRFPGFEITPDASGYYKVTHVYKRGPADKDFVRVHAGDFVLAVDGTPLRAGDNYWRLYGTAPGRKVEFTVNSAPSLEGAWTTRIEPVGATAYTTLQYEKWVDDRRAMTDKLSNGEIGYLHIRQMNQPALRKFERDLFDNRFKKALVIDQRFNPGGNIDQELLEILQQRQYQYTRFRDSVFQTRPVNGYFGPLAMLQNERSTSDAEVFPDGFRTLKLGKTVGVTTYGAVIGTGSYRLLDGSQLRTPGSGLWNVNGTNLENYGVPPDVAVDNSPADALAGRDAQLEKAVQVLQDDLRRLGSQEVPGRK
ncbi:MAG: PD40 domain-containing protein [Planctomycetes bacterium]|nr:PD40 domain-containing protein [Planctomycetota bacterium]